MSARSVSLSHGLSRYADIFRTTIDLNDATRMWVAGSISTEIASAKASRNPSRFIVLPSGQANLPARTELGSAGTTSTIRSSGKYQRCGAFWSRRQPRPSRSAV